ncbi:MAG TPA: hypothetical protein DEP48_02790 [Persephonella sp.]|uniref:Uncharacterized protein n=2 Tax=Hydrogenothermaceae TaxID=224027 RepID=C0QS76_PERMH|nr:hypothetical protein PERMA_1758 [Persephonella marina EX-H1]HCB69265.1 hypothetical protein [Persephonella sp.]
MFVSSCGYRATDFTEKKAEGKLQDIFCVRSVDINTPEATAVDIFYRYVSQAVLSAGYRLECSKWTDRYVYLTVKRLDVKPIGYSISQRAYIYKVSGIMELTVEDKEKNVILSREIWETVQYIGSGLSADIERRYAIEELARLVEARIFSILTELE